MTNSDVIAVLQIVIHDNLDIYSLQIINLCQVGESENMVIIDKNKVLFD